MPVDAFLAGVGLLGVTVGAASFFSARVVSRRLHELAGPPAWLAFAVITLAGFIALHLVPGALAILGPATVVACALLLATAAALIRPRPRERLTAQFPPAPPSGRLSWGIAAAGIALVSLYVLGWAADHGAVATRHVDMTTFHLPNVVRWMQTGSFWQIDEFVPHRSFGTYPNTSDVVLVGVMLPFDSDFLVRLTNIPLLAMTGLGIYCLGRELTAPAAPAALFAAALVATPVVTMIALEGLADTLMLAGFAAGMAFLVRHRRTGATTDLVVAGLGLGMSLGSKWYALPATAIVIAGWVLASVTDRRALRTVLKRAGALTALVGLAGGFWMLRNLVELGNPVFPVEVAFAGTTLFDAPPDVVRERTGFALAEYVDDPGIWRDALWPSLLAIMGWACVVLWAMLVPAAGAAWARLRRSRNEPQLRAIAWCALVAAGIGLAYMLTPYTAQGELGNPVLAAANSRYVVPALVICAALAAWVTGVAGRGRAAIELLGLVVLVDALRRNPNVSAAALAAGVAVLIACAGALVLARRAMSGTARPRRTLQGAAVTAAAVVVVAGLYAQSQRFHDGRYAEAASTDRWVLTHARSGHRVGVAGDGFVVHPMFGPRFGNEVEYVGHTVDGMLRPYERRAGFARALKQGRYDLVLLQDFGYVDPRLPRRQEGWLRDLGFDEVERDRQLVVGPQGVRLYRAPIASRGR